jgi:hypothetical protein
MLKILVNHPNLGFDDFEDAEEPEVTQVLSIPETTVMEGKPIALRFVRFQAVNSLHVCCHHILPHLCINYPAKIFIGSNHSNADDTCTRIDGLDILGNPVECVIFGFYYMKWTNGLAELQRNLVD